MNTEINKSVNVIIVFKNYVTLKLSIGGNFAVYKINKIK